MDFNSLGLLILRIIFAGVMCIQHGLSKLLSFSQSLHTFPDPLGIGSIISVSCVVFAEFLCAALVLLGLFTRFAIIPLIAVMAVAFFIIHSNDPFQKKEMALLYLAAFSCLFITGPGKFSADAVFRGVKK